MKRFKANHIGVLLAVTLWLTLAYSFSLFETLQSYRIATFTQIKLIVFVACVYGMTLTLARLFNFFKPVAIVLMLIAAPSAYFMQQYGVLIDPDMLINALETDPEEASDQLSTGLLLFTLLMGLLPAGLLARIQISKAGALTRLKQGGVAALCFLVLAVGTVVTSYDDFASLFRNHRDVKYRITPFNVISASVSVAKQHLAQPQRFISVGQDAFREISAKEKPHVMVVIVGETARADHFSVNGYERPTTTRLEGLAKEGQVGSFKNATSCGTATAISVPCMFSFYSADNYSPTARNTTNVLDVLKSVGIDVTWFENNSGCKNVCDRVTTINLSNEECESGSCFDDVLAKKLAQWLPHINSDSVIVLHQMGSHGPAYYERSPREAKQFLPECTSAELTDCSRQQIINAYDNSLVVTDTLVADVISLLERNPDLDSSVMYLSDHGESLGDNGIYLHGLPKWLAPAEQTHVPWVVWPKTRFKFDDFETASVSHDNLSHTLLGYFDVKTELYEGQLDLTLKQPKDRYASIAP